MNTPKFHGLKVHEDPQIFMDEVRKITHIMHVIEEKSVELAAYRIKDVTYNWVEM